MLFVVLNLVRESNPRTTNLAGCSQGVDGLETFFLGSPAACLLSEIVTSYYAFFAITLACDSDLKSVNVELFQVYPEWELVDLLNVDPTESPHTCLSPMMYSMSATLSGRTRTL